MTLNNLLKSIRYLKITGSAETEVTSIQYDSRKVEPGSIFVALKGIEADGHHFIDGVLVRWRACALSNVSITRCIDHALGKDRLPPRLAFDDHAADRVAFHDRCNAEAMQHGDDTGFFDQRIGDHFKAFGIEAVADRLRFGHRRTHGLCAFFKFAANAFAVDGGWVAIPGEPLDPDLRDIAAKTTIAFK